MKSIFKSGWRPIAAISIAILAATLFVSCQSPVGLVDAVPSKQQSTTFKKGEETMKTSQSAH